LEDTGVDGRIILRWIARVWVGGGTEWIELAQAILNQLKPPPVPMDRWRARVNAVMSLRAP